MGCRFCATGTMGLVANLTAGEILEQLAHANRIEKIRNVVFMGMGVCSLFTRIGPFARYFLPNSLFSRRAFLQSSFARCIARLAR